MTREELKDILVNDYYWNAQVIEDSIDGLIDLIKKHPEAIYTLAPVYTQHTAHPHVSCVLDDKENN